MRAGSASAADELQRLGWGRISAVAVSPTSEDAATVTVHVPDKYAQLKILGELRAQGILTEQEFQAEKTKILSLPS